MQERAEMDGEMTEEEKYEAALRNPRAHSPEEGTESVTAHRPGRQEMYVADPDRKADTITIGFKNPNMTMIPPIMRKLEEDPNVVLVRYIDTHPELDDRRIQVKVREGDAKDAVVKACEGLIQDFSGIEY